VLRVVRLAALHTVQCSAPKDTFSHQILLESEELPTSWENLFIFKEFFKKFGQKILNCTTEVKAVSAVNQKKMRICFSY
jgi:hypothetical protein